MESEAVPSFTNHISNNHEGVRVKQCGIILDKSLPYIGSSPDGIVSCSCCEEKSCLEVKCPFSINFLSPTSPEAKLPYLIREDDRLLFCA